MMKLKCIYLLCVVLALIGCESTKQTTEIGSNYIKNTSLGFNGYYFEVPAGYEIIDHFEDSKNLPESYRSWFETGSSFSMESLERFLFRGKNGYIFYSLNRHPISKTIVRMDEYEKRRLLTDSLADWEAFHLKDRLINKGVGEMDGRFFAYAVFSNPDEPWLTILYSVMGKLREEYRFRGYALNEDRILMDSDIRKIIASIED